MSEKPSRRGSGSATDSSRTGPADPAGQPGRGSAEMVTMVLTTDRKTRLERRPVPTPRDDQVLVDVDLCGICGSDLHAAETPEVYLGGFIMGHEPVGRVARVGREVGGWRRRPAGRHQSERRHLRRLRGVSRRAPEPLRSRDAQSGLSASRPTARWPPHVAVSPKTLHAIPDEMGRVESAWVEPAATALRAVLAAGDLTGRSILVVGGGPIGQLSCRAREALRGGAYLVERAIVRAPELCRRLTG